MKVWKGCKGQKVSISILLWRFAQGIVNISKCWQWGLGTGFEETLRSLSGGNLGYETKLSTAGLVFWFYGKRVICTVLKLDQDKETIHLPLSSIHTDDSAY